MASFNKVILVGNLTRDPETRVTANGLTICKLGLAVSRVFSTREGERKEETTFIDIDAFGKQAEVLTKYLRKGSPLMVEGRLKLDQWESSEGQKRSKLGVVLENFQFLGGGRDSDSSSSGGSGNSGNSGGYEDSSPPRHSAPAAADHSSSVDTLDEDIPF